MIFSYVYVLFSMRCQVPKNLRGNLKEPGKVKADGNCLFHAVAMAINMNGRYVGEDLASMLRLYALTKGETEMEYFIQKVNELDKFGYIVKYIVFC
jgi:hypothetical protein